jgi:hypothetical protein
MAVMRLRVAIALAAALVGMQANVASAQPAAASSVAAKYPDVAKCLFVYGALYESARKHARPDLESYTLQRLMWVRGFSEALASDPVWKAQFETGIKDNKKFAESIEGKIASAVASGSAREFNAAVSEGEACDLRLGLYSRKR